VKSVNVILFLLAAAVICSAFFLGDKIFRHLNKGNALPAESRVGQYSGKSDSAPPSKADLDIQEALRNSSRPASAPQSGDVKAGPASQGATVNQGGTQKRGAATTREAREIRVVMYMTDWCPYCTKAREYIRSQGVYLIEYNIERDRNAAEEMTRKTGGRRGVPVIDVEGIILRGYNPQAIANAIKQKQSG
jgi:glutaredoxin-like YruB-family protein